MWRLPISLGLLETASGSVQLGGTDGSYRGYGLVEAILEADDEYPYDGRQVTD